MEIIYYECLESTQKKLVDLVREGKIKSNTAIVAKKQTAGVGSRNNSWEAMDGDLLFSFAVKKDDLPDDLPISSASIYFAFLMKELLNSLTQNCWLKWPNDIYIKNKKCGGVVTQLLKGYYIVGIGINLVKRENDYAYCDIEISVEKMLNSYFMLLKKRVEWQEVFSKYRIEFRNNNEFLTTIKGRKIAIKSATLSSDGALIVDNERIYSLR